MSNKAEVRPCLVIILLMALVADGAVARAFLHIHECSSPSVTCYMVFTLYLCILTSSL